MVDDSLRFLFTGGYDIDPCFCLYLGWGIVRVEAIVISWISLAVLLVLTVL